MWQPALDELAVIDPGRRTVALDLPGHGTSPAARSYDLDVVAELVHGAVEDAGLEAPVLVGHSISGVIATLYAARYPTRGVVNVDQTLEVEPVIGLVESVATQLRGPGFPRLWAELFFPSMHAELLPPAGRELVRSTSRPDQQLVLGYWRQLLDGDVGAVVEMASDALAAVRRSGVAYLYIAGADVEPGYARWLAREIPQAETEVWPGSGHFPHLADPQRFAKVLATTGRWTA
jgi:pimeloyl-ACP methyl ester carboxylesterase